MRPSLRPATGALAALWAAALTLSGCDLAPPYLPPAAPLPTSYQPAPGWVVANPQTPVDSEAWWRVYANPTLDALEPRIAENPDLAASVAALRQARDLVSEVGYTLLPTINAGASFSANRQSDHRPLRGPTQPNNYGSNTLDIAAQWELDLWSAVRNSIRAQRRTAEAAAANTAALRLSLQAELATDYVLLRALDQQAAIYRQAIAYYRTGVEITELRLTHKIGSKLDVDQAQNQLSATAAQASALEGRREQLIHALAILVGAEASSFTLPDQSGEPLRLPDIAPGLPSTLLQRRPDIAEAERQMSAANKLIGVARAAFYPNVTLSATGGTQDTGFGLASLPNGFWSLGSALALPLFEGGLRHAVLDRFKAYYDQTTDTYRSVVLNALGEVEDQLSLERTLAVQKGQEDLAATSAQGAQALSLQLYQQGAADYLNVVIQEGAALSANLAAAQVAADREQASVNLIRALGGGWSRESLASAVKR